MFRDMTKRSHYAESSFTPVRSNLLQRKCGCGQHTVAGGECSECSKQRLQRRTAGQAEPAEVPSVVHEVLRSPGKSLDPSTRAFMEPRFGHDFSHVRVHTDANAAESARAVNALAYTVGREVVFGAGQYAPGSGAGRDLLAHELTHVIQQGGGTAQTPLSLGAKDDAHESEASVVAQSIRAGSEAPSPRTEASSPQIQRLPAPEEAQPVPDVEEEEEEATADTSEVKDGDAPVEASPDAAEATEEPSLEGTLLALAGEGAVEEKGEGGTAKKTEAAGEKTKEKPKTPPAKKAPPKTITRIDVDQAAQTMTITWSDGTKEGPRPVSTGKGQPNTKEDPCKSQTEKNCTPNGDFKVGTMGNGSTKNSHGDHMSWYVGFVDNRGIGIHNSQPVPGTPASHGCVRVGNTPADDAFAKKVNKNVVPGTTVVSVSGKAATTPWKKATPAPKKSTKKKK